MKYSIAIFVAIIVAIIIIWTIYRNFRDRKQFEKEMGDPANNSKHFKRGDKT
jgi:hypothetical protein